ncbi:MAG TPA: FAD-binding oxidoreductase [Terriglobia bacterium]|nr:FAD-binding oxidoreductase [Terriglobia bacterium]
MDFTSIASGDRGSVAPEICAAYAVDGVTPSCALRPSTPEQVAEMLKYAAARGLAVIPCGNGTKLGLGAPPQRYDAALCLRDLNRATYYEPDDLVASVEPGMTLGMLQQMLGEHRLWLPLDPAGGDRATIGGILAANSAGPLRLRYGGPRDMVLGMKIATPEGKIVKTGGRVVKNVAGYDLAKLLIGSYGTLGVIVEATLKLYPRIATRTTWTIEMESFASAREFRRRLLASPLRPLRAVLLNAAARTLADSGGGEGVESSGPEIVVEAGGSERVLTRYQTELGALAAGINATINRREDSAARGVWARVADFGNWVTRECHAACVLRAALPIAAAEDFLERTEAEGRDDGWQLAGAAQLGVGVVEVGFSPNPEPRIPSLATIEKLRRAAATLGGSTVVAHCPHDLKSKLDVWGPPGDDFETMRSLKAAWDPKSTLTPGRFVGGL